MIENEQIYSMKHHVKNTKILVRKSAMGMVDLKYSWAWTARSGPKIPSRAYKLI
jgi:hypothetical protein